MRRPFTFPKADYQFLAVANLSSALTYRPETSIQTFYTYIMWHSLLKISLNLIPLVAILATANPEHYRDARQGLAAKIASTRSYNFAHSTNLTELIFGPQLYEAPLICIPPHNSRIIPRAYGTRLARDESISEHQAVMGKDICPFIQNAFHLLWREWLYFASDVEDQLLIAIRSLFDRIRRSCESRVYSRTITCTRLVSLTKKSYNRSGTYKKGLC